MFVRQLIAIGVLLFSHLILLDKAVAADELQLFEDSTSLFTLLIPRTLFGKEKKSQYGLSWQDSMISIDTLNFPSERPLRDIYEKLKGRSGRHITRDEYTEAAFVIEGVDRGDSRFIVQVQETDAQGVSGKSGISVVYSNRGGRRLHDLAQDVAESFQPGSLTIDPETSTGSYLQEARRILADVASDPAKFEKVWAQFGVLIRKYRLRVRAYGCERGRASAFQRLSRESIAIIGVGTHSSWNFTKLLGVRV